MAANFLVGKHILKHRGLNGRIQIYIYIYIYIYHHTVQVAMCAYSFVRTLVNALVLQ